MAGIHEVPPEPEAGPSKPSSVPSLHSSIRTGLRAAQKYSAYVFLGFAATHLTSTVLLPPLSHSLAEQWFWMSRAVYQSPEIEYLLVYGSIAVHILSGLVLHAERLVKSVRESRAFSTFTAGSISGYILTASVIGHLAATRWGPQIYLGDSNDISLDYITYTLQTTPVETSLALVFTVGSFAYHASFGMQRWLKLRINRSILVGAAVAAAAVSLFALAKEPSVPQFLAEQFKKAHQLVDF